MKKVEVIEDMLAFDKNWAWAMEVDELENRISDLKQAIYYLDCCNEMHYQLWGEDDELLEGIYKKMVIQDMLNYFEKVYNKKKTI